MPAARAPRRAPRRRIGRTAGRRRRAARARRAESARWEKIGPVSSSASMRWNVIADLLVAFADRPRDRQRAAVPRQQRRVAVEPAEARDGERIRRDLPREAHAHHEVGLHRGEQGRDRRPARGHEDVELHRGAHHELARIRDGAVASVGVPHRQERDRLVPRLAYDGVEALRAPARMRVTMTTRQLMRRAGCARPTTGCAP